VTATVITDTFVALRLTTAYQYLGWRFRSPGLRKVGAMLFAIRMVLYLGSALYVPALALHQVAGISLLVSSTATGALAAGYTVTGGMRAVIATDLLQVRIRAL